MVGCTAVSERIPVPWNYQLDSKIEGDASMGQLRGGAVAAVHARGV
jgi:hypothetical protein